MKQPAERTTNHPRGTGAPPVWSSPRSMARAPRHRLAKAAILLLSLVLLPMTGCSEQHPATRPARLSDRADQALKDPFNYKTPNDRVDISGGDLGHFDKNAFGKDVDSVLNP